MLYRFASCLSIAAIATGCFHHRAHDVTASVAAAQPSSGAIDVVLASPSRKLSVVVDGRLVVDRVHSRKAHIDGVPAGPAHVRVGVAGHCERDAVVDQDVEVPAGGTATILLPGPEHRRICRIVTAAVLAALIIK
jgi:hypothetical protein